MLDTLKITLKENSKSYQDGNEQRVTRIEVDSDVFNEDTMYQDVTTETYMRNQFRELLHNNCNPII